MRRIFWERSEEVSLLSQHLARTDDAQRCAVPLVQRLLLQRRRQDRPGRVDRLGTAIWVWSTNGHRLAGREIRQSAQAAVAIPCERRSAQAVVYGRDAWPG